MHEIFKDEWISECSNWEIKVTKLNKPKVFCHLNYYNEVIDMDQVDVPEVVQDLYNKLLKSIKRFKNPRI